MPATRPSKDNIIKKNLYTTISFMVVLIWMSVYLSQHPCIRAKEAAVASLSGCNYSSCCQPVGVVSQLVSIRHDWLSDLLIMHSTSLAYLLASYSFFAYCVLCVLWIMYYVCKCNICCAKYKVENICSHSNTLRRHHMEDKQCNRTYSTFHLTLI